MKESVICFAVGNIDYLDPITIAINSFVEYNKDIKLVVFLTDGTSTVFRKKIGFENVIFRDIYSQEVVDFCKKHKNHFNATSYCFAIDKMADLFIANEALDIMVKEYRNQYDVLLRLDMDVFFLDSILPSINNFIASNCRVGGIFEDRHRYYKPSIDFTNITVDNYINAGSMMFRLDDKTISDHLKQSIDIIEAVGLSTCPYPDQDALNLIYPDNTKYDATPDGWWIPMLNYARRTNRMIFVHFASVAKPFNAGTEDTADHVFRDAYPYYLELAKKYNCHPEFIQDLTNVINEVNQMETKFHVNISRMQFKMVYDMKMNNTQVTDNTSLQEKRV